MKTTEATKTHPFELAGLGIAPFRVVGVEERRGPITLPGGTIVGAPGQPMGCCAYCSTGIAECWSILSSDGRRFVVGCDCVRKTNDARLVAQLAPELRRLRREKRAALAARKRAELDELLSSPAAEPLARLPHPVPYRAAMGETALDSYRWMARNAGAAGRARTLKAVRQALAGAVNP